MRRVAYCVASVALATLTPSSPLAQAPPQPSAIVITVIDDLSGRPLANADIIDLSTNRHRFTDEQGQARLAWPTDGVLRLRVREVGYKPIERTLKAGQDATDGTATFGMSRVAYVIAPVRSTSRCATDSDPASRLLSVSVLEQLRQGAEKYEHFQRSYPFEARIVRRRAGVNQSGGLARVESAPETFRSGSWEGRYRPGDIVERAGRSDWQVPILFLSTLADPRFWEHHCFVARGVESLGGSRVVRLEFSPIASVRGPDWEGAALLDSATSMLKRVEFSVVNLKRKGPRRVEGYSSYRTPSPFVVMPDTTVAVTWYAPVVPGGTWGHPDAVQMIYIDSLSYRKAVPPSATTPVTVPQSSPAPP